MRFKNLTETPIYVLRDNQYLASLLCMIYYTIGLCVIYIEMANILNLAITSMFEYTIAFEHFFG